MGGKPLGFESSSLCYMSEYILSPEFVCDVLKKLEDKKVFPATIRMHIADYAHIRKFGRKHLDIETHRELLLVGMMGTLFGLPVKVNTKEKPSPGAHWRYACRRLRWRNPFILSSM